MPCSSSGRTRSQANAGRMTLIVVTLTTGTVLLMWIGEQITKRGIGNGISILIFASILTSLPLGVSAWWNGGPMERIFFPLIALGIVASVVFVQEGQRRIPIQYAKRHGRTPDDDRWRHLPAVAHQHGGRDPGHLRGRSARVPGDDRAVLPGHPGVRQRPLPARQPDVPAHRGGADHPVHVLLHRRPVQPGRAGRQPPQVRRLHPRHQAGPADRAVPRPCPDPADACPGRSSSPRSRSLRASSSSTAASRRRTRAPSAAPPC